MEAWLEAFGESSGIFAIMNTAWGWPVVESLHFLGLSLLIGTVGLFDLRVLGMAPRIPLAALHRLVPYGVAGWLLNATTGFMFLASFPDQYVYNPAFQTKLLFMLIAGFNVLLFYQVSFRALRALSPGARPALSARGFALVSLLCWMAVITCGRLITFYRPPAFWCFWCG